MSQMRSYRSEPRAGIVRAHTDQAADTRPSFELVLLPTASHRRPLEPDLFFLPSPKRDLIGGFNGEYKKVSSLRGSSSALYGMDGSRTYASLIGTRMGTF